MSKQETRKLAGHIFNNLRFAEVVLTLDREPMPLTAQEIAKQIGALHGSVTQVLHRLDKAGLVKTKERLGGERGPLPYEAQAGPLWDVLAALCRAITHEGS